MNLSPSGNQPVALLFRLAQDTAQIAARDAGCPVKVQPARPVERDLRFATLPDDMNMRRAVIVDKDHEAEAEGTMDRHHWT
jgi:hypothetical protein